MKAICRYSGLEFQIQYFPFTLSNSILHHPVFDIPLPELFSLAENVQIDHEKYNPISKRLYFLALLKSTGLIEFRTFARPKDSVIAANMESLIEWAGFIQGCRTKEQYDALPRFVISQDTASLEYIDGWFQTWKEAVEEYKDHYRSYNAAQIQIRREAALERLIKDPSRTTESYASALAEWAAVAAEFSEGLIPSPFNGDQITLSEYWKDILRKCGSKTFQIWKLDLQDMKDLEEHLELALPHGSIVAHETMILIRSGIRRHESSLGITSLSSGTTFTILANNDGVEKANMVAAAAQAPSIEPKQQDYPNKVAFLRAKARWELAQKLAALETDSESNNALKGL